MYAIRSKGVGKRPDYRILAPGQPLPPGFTFSVDEDPAGKVLDADGVSLRNEREADRTTAKSERVSAKLSALFQSPDPDEQLLAALFKQLALDVARLKGVTPAQYRADLLSRISS